MNKQEVPCVYMKSNIIELQWRCHSGTRRVDAVRKRPGMYIGSTDGNGASPFGLEIVDNAVDEALICLCLKLDVTINKDGSLSVADQGRGMPTGMHAMGKPTVEVSLRSSMLEESHWRYKISGGLHGGSVSQCPFLAGLRLRLPAMELAHKQRFKDGGSLLSSLERLVGLAKSKTGNYITFMPDPNHLLNDRFQV